MATRLSERSLARAWAGTLLCSLLLLPAQYDTAGAAGTASALATAHAVAPETPDELTARLVAEGFENVSVSHGAGKVVVRYDNRVYRYPARALQRVILIAGAQHSDAETITIVPLSGGIPLFSLTFLGASYREWQAGRRPLETFLETLEIDLDVTPGPDGARSRGVNPHTWKLDLVGQPQFAADFGNFDDPVESQINLSPIATASLWRGMRVTTQLILPLQDDLGGGGIRPGLLTASQVVRLPFATFAAVDAGYFTNNRYGFQTELRTYLLEGRAYVGGQASRTGYARFSDRTWNYGGFDTWSLFARAGVVAWPEHQLALHATYGRFLFGDTGLRFDVQRAFGEVEIGFFGLLSGGEKNAGVNLSIPLPGSRYARPGRFRVRPARAFAWEYRYRKIPRTGLSFDAGHDLDALWQDLHPATVRAQLRELDGWPTGDANAPGSDAL